jgi:hypothetical protein
MILILSSHDNLSIQYNDFFDDWLVHMVDKLRNLRLLQDVSFISVDKISQQRKRFDVCVNGYETLELEPASKSY